MRRFGPAGGTRLALTATVLAAVIGLGFSVTLGWLLMAEQQAHAQQEFDRRTELASSAVRAQTSRYLDLVRTVSASTGAFTELTAAKYAQVTESMQAMHLGGATSMTFLVPATDEQIPAVQSLWRSRGATGLVLKPVGTGREHFFSVLTARLEPGAKPRPGGTDASQAAAPAQALELARRTGQIAVSQTYQLIVDRGLPAAQRQLSFVLTAPVLAPPDAQGHRAFQGWILMGVHGQDFMGETLKGTSQDLMDVTLRARNADESLMAVATLRAPSTHSRDLHRTVQIDVADRRWQLDLQAAARDLPGAGAGLPITVTIGGSLVTLLLVALVYVLATGRDRARTAVIRATADLVEQKTLLEAIMDSVGESIVVIDDRAEFLMYNTAAAPLLEVDGVPVATNAWAQHFRRFLPDGVTPFPKDQLPFTRALAGESTQGVEMIICSPEKPEGIAVLITTRPLDRRAGRRGAVAVFHDITERRKAEAERARIAGLLSTELSLRKETEARLRARDEELTAFAGMLAHDLKAPLRAIGGFTQILRSDLEDAGGGTAVGLGGAGDTMGKILAATRRMGQLIDDTLAYAVARDRTLDPRDVDLSALVAEVFSELTSHLPADAPPGERPALEAGPLPIVRADPVMCRQLVSNVIGNALKYTPADRPARIHVSARAETGSWVRIDIRDHGIGIPASEHEKVFVTFHRAHSEYPGTGLGLAICHRIVERHGGVIGVEDNAGGGSLFYFTLPAGAGPAEPAGLFRQGGRGGSERSGQTAGGRR